MKSPSFWRIVLDTVFLMKPFRFLSVLKEIVFSLAFDRCRYIKWYWFKKCVQSNFSTLLIRRYHHFQKFMFLLFCWMQGTESADGHDSNFVTYLNKYLGSFMVLVTIRKELFFFSISSNALLGIVGTPWERITKPATQDLFKALSSLPAPRLTPGAQVKDTAQLLMKRPIQINTDFQ